ncbi:MAG: sigma factor [Arachnia sp.]
MSITQARLEAPLLTAAQEVDLARRIEAGIYAEHLLATQHPRPGLPQVVQRGREARRRLWLSNLRLVMKFAADAARAHSLPIDDLFQEGCLALAEVIVRFDATRGSRFSTLAYPYLKHAIRREALRRCGALQGTKAANGQARISTLDGADPACLAVPGGYAAIDRVGTDFLELLGQDGELLKRRYGIGCRAQTLREVAQDLDLSASTVARAEAHALRRAREVLSDERCRVHSPAVSALSRLRRSSNSVSVAN